MRYKWRLTNGVYNPNESRNVALREAMVRRVPLIWFIGVGDGLLQAIYPIYLIAEEPDSHQFVVAFDDSQSIGLPASSSDAEAVRRYRTTVSRVRLHQRVFRSTVMRAYRTRCAVCNLRHDVLLDAAHIIPDGAPGGEPTVQNGLSLCKIHHAAFDAKILGIKPDLTVHIRHDLLDEIDGPMLRHGLQDLHGARLMAIPAARRERPDKDRLAQAFQAFRDAELPRMDTSHPTHVQLTPEA